MNKLTLIFILFFPLFVFSENYSFNRENLIQIIESNLYKTSDFTVNSSWHSGTSLLEALPLMEDIYKMEIFYESKTATLENDDICEIWGESYLVKDGSAITLFFNNIEYRNLTKLNFSGTPMESSNLTVWLNWEGIESLKSEISYFAQIHNLEISTLTVPKPESKLIAVTSAGGKIPDLVMVKSSSIEKLVQSRSIQNLNYIKMRSILPQGENAFTLNNKTWGLPFYFDTQTIIYNKDLITSIPGKNWTLRDMENIAESLLSSNIHPMVWNAYGSNWLIPFQVSFGKENLLNNDNSITITDGPTEDALKYLIKIKKEGLLVPMERDAMDSLFISGKVGMIISGSYTIPYFESLNLNFGILPFPINQKTGIELSPLLDYKGFTLTKKSKAPILARRLLQYLLGSGIQQRFCLEYTKLPARSHILDNPKIPYGYVNILEKSINTGIVIPPDRIYSIYKNNMWKLLRFALSGKMSIKDTLQKGQILINNSMNNNN